VCDFWIEVSDGLLAQRGVALGACPFASSASFSTTGIDACTVWAAIVGALDSQILDAPDCPMQVVPTTDEVIGMLEGLVQDPCTPGTICEAIIDEAPTLDDLAGLVSDPCPDGSVCGEFVALPDPNAWIDGLMATLEDPCGPETLCGSTMVDALDHVPAPDDLAAWVSEPCPETSFCSEGYEVLVDCTTTCDVPSPDPCNPMRPLPDKGLCDPLPTVDELLTNADAPLEFPLFLSNGATRDQGVKFSPAGCVGKVNNPHQSTKEPTKGKIKGHAEANCEATVDSLYMKVQLWRHRWWGYEKVGKPGNNTNEDTKHTGASGVFDGCEENDWRTEANGTSVEDGEEYYAHGFKYAAVVCT
jgi:hypothetical protein